MLLNCGVGEDSWESLGLQGDPTSPSQRSPWNTSQRIFLGKTDAEAETPIIWPSDVKNWLIGKDPDAEKDWGREKKGKTEGEMVVEHHQLYGHEFEQALGVSDGQGCPVCCSPWGRKESGTTEQLSWAKSLPKSHLWTAGSLQCFLIPSLSWGKLPEFKTGRERSAVRESLLSPVHCPSLHTVQPVVCSRQGWVHEQSRAESRQPGGGSPHSLPSPFCQPAPTLTPNKSSGIPSSHSSSKFCVSSPDGKLDWPKK